MQGKQPQQHCPVHAESRGRKIHAGLGFRATEGMGLRFRSLGLRIQNRRGSLRLDGLGEVYLVLRHLSRL